MSASPPPEGESSAAVRGRTESGSLDTTAVTTTTSQDLALAVVMLCKDLALSTSKLGSLFIKEAKANEREVLEAAREAAIRCQVLALSVNRYCSEAPTYACAAIPTRLAKTQTRLVELVDAVKRYYLNPFDLQAAQDVLTLKQKTTRANDKLVLAATRASDLCRPQTTGTPRSGMTPSSGAAMVNEAGAVARECSEAFKAVQASVKTRDQAKYMEALKRFVQAFTAAVGFSERTGIGMEDHLKETAMRTGVLSKAAFLCPEDAGHQEQFALVAKDVARIVASLAGSVIAPSSASASSLPAVSSPLSEPSVPPVVVPRAVSVPRISPPVSPPHSPLSGSGGGKRGAGQQPKGPALEILEILFERFPAFKQMWTQEPESSSQSMIDAINTIVFPLPPPPPSTPAPPLPTSPHSARISQLSLSTGTGGASASAGGPKLPSGSPLVVRASLAAATAAASTAAQQEVSARHFRSNSTPTWIEQEDKQQATEEAIAGMASMTTIEPTTQSLAQVKAMTPRRQTRSASGAGAMVQVVLSMDELTAICEKSVDALLTAARTHVQRMGATTVSMEPDIVTVMNRSLTQLVEGCVKHCVVLIPRCTVVDRGFASTAAPASSSNDFSFDGQSNTITKCEFLGVALLERALVNCRRLLQAPVSPLKSDDAVVSAASGPDFSRVLSCTCDDVARKSRAVGALMAHVKCLVATGLSEAGPSDIQGIFAVCVHMLGSVLALSTSFASLATATETLRCVNARARASLSAAAATSLRVDLGTAIASNDIGQATEMWGDVTVPLVEQNGGGFRGGNLNHIVQKATSDQSYDNAFLKCTILTYRSYTTPTELLHKLRERYTVPKKALPDTRTTAVKLRVGVFLKTWVEMQPGDFDEAAISDLQEFLELLKKDGHGHLVGSISTAVEAIKSARDLRTVAVPAEVEELEISIADVFAEASEADIAKQLTVHDYELFHAIQAVELLDQNWSRKRTKYRSPTVLALITRSNAVSFWVVTTILSQLVISQRAKMFTKFILIADHLRKLSNFNSLMGILAGLTMTPVSRLRHTIESVKPPYIAIFEQLQELMSPAGSFKNYRDALRQSTTMTLPYLGTALSDLTFIGDGNPDFIEGITPGAQKMVNHKKQEMTYAAISQLQLGAQQPKCPIPRVEPLFSALTELPHCKEDVLYDLSVQLEPRNSKRSDLV